MAIDARSKILSEPLDGKYGKIAYRKRTICEVHREMYDMVVIALHTRPRELVRIVNLIEEAYIMATKMNMKLIEYKCGQDGWADSNDTGKAEASRAKRVALLEILNAQKDWVRQIEKYQKEEKELKEKLSEEEARLLSEEKED